MTEILPEKTSRFLRAMMPDRSDTLRSMEDQAGDITFETTSGKEIQFPMIGPEAGCVLRLIARMVDARRIFEFGSGYGYSACWFAEALPPDGEIVLTEYDSEYLDKARSFLTEAGYADLATFERGDAFETIERYEGPFDVVLIDCGKADYLDAFEAVRDKVPAGGVIVADNAMTSGAQDFDLILRMLEGEEPDEVDEGSRGIADYLRTVLADDQFETVGIPIREGLAVSYKLS